MLPIRPTQSPKPLARLTFLKQGDCGLVAIPEPEGHPRPTYPLCPIPSTLLDWMVNSARAFWQEHRRCISFALLFNPECQHWSLDLPQQNCRKTESDWSTETAKLSGPSQDYYLAGNFQSQPDEFTGFPLPTFDGMHLLLRIKDDDVQLHAVMRWSEDNFERVEPQFLIRDDFYHTLQVATSRIELL